MDMRPHSVIGGKASSFFYWTYLTNYPPYLPQASVTPFACCILRENPSTEEKSPLWHKNQHGIPEIQPSQPVEPLPLNNTPYHTPSYMDPSEDAISPLLVLNELNTSLISFTIFEVDYRPDRPYPLHHWWIKKTN